MFSIQQPLLVLAILMAPLLDSHSYDWQPAAPGSAVYEANIPVILCSGKTSAEMLYLQKCWGYKAYR